MGIGIGPSFRRQALIRVCEGLFNGLERFVFFILSFPIDEGHGGDWTGLTWTWSVTSAGMLE